MTRTLRFLALTVMTLGLAAVAASSATAVPPQVVHYEFAPFTDTALCGFAIEMSFEGTVTDRLHTDQEGNPVRDVATFPNFTVTFTHGDTSLSTKGPALGITNFNPDGSVESFTIVGMNAAIALPGQGHILLDAGRLVFDGDGNIVAENGPHQVFGTSDAPAFCAAMA